MSDFYFGGDFLSDLNRVQRQMSSLLGNLPSSIRASRADAFPSLNVGSTDEAIEVVAFVPGVEPASLDVTVDKGLLTISGERRAEALTEGSRTYARERFTGVFRRVIELPQNADADKVEARYENGTLFIVIGKREASKPRAITIQ
ncbi:Hsp20/alpha crystallin family protein [Caballeronia sp. GAWG1-1]|jgi:HSP20 family protein|uniref:Hsp20/alpha crystallin family protein n=1 Tax=Caballeronia sp. GAWG1-1 TaxID=2921742 RepID=UPI002028587F|nr:Hsp20/alpha crystallin family protein [Caballeronia sp. GAWG1-1]